MKRGKRRPAAAGQGGEGKRRTGSQRLRRNHGAYHGETIDIADVLAGSQRAAEASGWEVAKLPLGGGATLLAYHRPAARAKLRAYFSAGIHGDEPAGPLAVRQLLRENRWPAGVEFWVCPGLNPTGFPLNRRENTQGLDLNRDYRHFETAEVRAHVAWLEQAPSFDVCFCLHEDWEAHGFYLYELNPDHRPSLAEPMIAAVARVCPIDQAPEIDGRTAVGGIIRPDLDPTKRPRWPEAFYLIRNKTRQSYTLEAPSDFPLAVRVRALVAALRSAFRNLAA